MDFSGLLVQLLNGLASGSTLFLVSVGLSLVFGVMRIVNFAHGSLYVLGLYVAYSCVAQLGAMMGYWPALLIAPLLVGLLGAVIEIVLLRRLYRAPELLQLLATFALVLILRDAALWFWGAEDLLGPRAPGLAGAVTVLGRRFPTYDLFLIVVGPLVWLALALLLRRTRWGTLVRAATLDREMLGALGVQQAWLFTAVFALGALLAGLAGALQLPREPANLELDLPMVATAFVIVVVGGMGSLSGALLAALLIAELKAVCIWLGVVQIGPFVMAFPKLTLVAEFLVMAVVLVWRPWGLMGRPQAAVRGQPQPVLAPASPWGAGAWWLVLAVLAALPLLAGSQSYAVVLLTDMAIAALFAASLQAIVGPGGLHSFGHAAYFGLGAYGAALLVHTAGLPFAAALVLAPLVAAAGALVYGWFCMRLSGIYLAMLTLAFAQITWAVAFQWDDFTGGSNGIAGVWPPAWLAEGARFYWLVLLLCAAAICLLRRLLQAPLGWALRAARDSAVRAEAMGLPTRRVQWAAFVVAGLAAGLAGALAAFSKGGAAPQVLSVEQSVDALVMVLLGGVQALAGPVLGAAAFTWLHDMVARLIPYWRAVLGAVMLLLILVFPDGISGFTQKVKALTARKSGANGVAP